jgi:hypothetical protein
MENEKFQMENGKSLDWQFALSPLPLYPFPFFSGK